MNLNLINLKTFLKDVKRLYKKYKKLPKDEDKIMQYNNKKFKLINVIGIDEAGKTTLARQLAKTLQKNDRNVRYAYCQYFAKLLYPIKLLARLTVMRHTNEFKNYNIYNQTKQETSKKHPIFAGIYTLIWLVDYLIQVFLKVSLPLIIEVS